MRKSTSVGLLAKGRLRDYPLLGLRGVREQVGPVMAGSIRQATRISNAIRAGYPVRRLAELAPCRTILICVPAAKLPGVTSEMLMSGLNWRRRVVLLGCGTSGSEVLDDLAELGAAVGSITPLDEAEGRYFVEGDRLAGRVARQLVEDSGGTAVEVLRGSFLVCQAVFSAASWLSLPMMDASVACLRHAGLTAGSAATIAERMISQSLRSYVKAGARACKPPRTKPERLAFLRQLAAVRQFDPPLADYLRGSAVQILGRAGRSTGWLATAGPTGPGLRE